MVFGVEFYKYLRNPEFSVIKEKSLRGIPEGLFLRKSGVSEFLICEQASFELVPIRSMERIEVNGHVQTLRSGRRPRLCGGVVAGAESRLTGDVIHHQIARRQLTIRMIQLKAVTRHGKAHWVGHLCVL